MYVCIMHYFCNCPSGCWLVNNHELNLIEPIIIIIIIIVVLQIDIWQY